MFAVVTVALFIALNVNPKEASMAKNQDNKTFVQDSALVPKMEKKSANIPKQEQKPKPAPPADKN